jgi:hypothetical protein
MYIIHGQVPKNVNSSKYLGLNIYKTFSYDNYVNKVTQKAHNSNPLSFSSRNISCCPANINANAISHLQDHPWNTRLQFRAQQRKKSSASSRQSNSKLLVSPLGFTETNQQCYSDDEKTKLDTVGSQTQQSPPGHYVPDCVCPG